MSLRYVSTRGGVAPCRFEEALFAGLAGDGGLYLPERWPRLERDELAALQGASYQEVAARVLAPFVGDDLGDGRAARADRTRVRRLRSRRDCAAAPARAK